MKMGQYEGRVCLCYNVIKHRNDFCIDDEGVDEHEKPH